MRKDSSYYEPNMQVNKYDIVKISKIFDFIGKSSSVQSSFINHHLYWWWFCNKIENFTDFYKILFVYLNIRLIIRSNFKENIYYRANTCSQWDSLFYFLFFWYENPIHKQIEQKIAITSCLKCPRGTWL